MRTLLEDVENVRRAKMYEGMGSAAQEVQQAVKVINQQFRARRVFFVGLVPCPRCRVCRLVSETFVGNNGTDSWHLFCGTFTTTGEVLLPCRVLPVCCAKTFRW